MRSLAVDGARILPSRDLHVSCGCGAGRHLATSSVLPCLVLHTAVNAWPSVIPLMVGQDGSNLRPFQIAVWILVVVAIAVLFAVHGLWGRFSQISFRRKNHGVNGGL